jgi:hypothetical protein
MERLLEAVLADESRRTVVALPISRSIIAAQGSTLEDIRREGEGVMCSHQATSFQLTISRSSMVG